SSWRTLSFKEVVSLWRNSRDFAEMFTDSVKAVPFAAVFWESAPVTRTTMDKPYEYVMVDSPRLAKVSADGSPFAEYIDGGKHASWQVQVSLFSRSCPKNCSAGLPYLPASFSCEAPQS
ncbi:unnamed protein product, partial [Hapterophycus canaliculatus]